MTGRCQQRAATRDSGQIAGWWAERHHDIGIACGPNGLLVVDIGRFRGDPPPEWAGMLGGARSEP